MSTPEEVGSVNIGPGTIDPRDFQAPVSSVDPDFYVAVLVTEGVTEGSDKPLYEESFVLLKAESEEEAREKAAEYGKQQETSYRNENDQDITWKLRHVVDVRLVEDATFDDGSELYSRFFRNFDGYRSFEPLLGGEEL
ncbi:uncharacterized protein DUF4288 [Saccharopolyspora erythraea NRRL 2338]|uniref:Uncharacterized protein n=2 Tax=Saccharopolyspora erythraea TaxID=1836 RepID=A4F871_SACEN|nr:DUF4288 domain-containing protein [Saccharopolyspora erythraea]EQD84961.1 hypothetical protein N599_17420 [Saccharopolyspora erythraea D]PFG94040.1 uncharacterized protein DUF4288 [Saccharopolyspora erythraea NRRL 2338]QRK90842.1 DUF4288 domain-containing protein [Saccharopolyspora erythraea]CAM00246.1 hypothetical protein SACE_0912 [Saccharopolyspora erythraea NRRL 2338]